MGRARRYMTALLAMSFVVLVAGVAAELMGTEAGPVIIVSASMTVTFAIHWFAARRAEQLEQEIADRYGVPNTNAED